MEAPLVRVSGTHETLVSTVSLQHRNHVEPYPRIKREFPSRGNLVQVLPHGCQTPRDRRIHAVELAPLVSHCFHLRYESFVQLLIRSFYSNSLESG